MRQDLFQTLATCAAFALALGSVGAMTVLPDPVALTVNGATAFELA